MVAVLSKSAAAFRNPLVIKVGWFLAGMLGISLSACDMVPKEFTDFNLPVTNKSGALSYTVQTQKTPDQKRELRNQVTATVAADTFIWQPWFATAQGTLNVTRDITTGGTAETDVAVASGAVSVNVLPLSQFPTTVSYSRSDSSVDGNATSFGSDTTIDRASLNSRVFLPDNWNVSTLLTLENNETGVSDKDQFFQGAVEVNKLFENSSMNLLLKHDDTSVESRAAGFRDGQTDFVNFRHNYKPFEEVTVQSSSTLLRSIDDNVSVNRETFSLQGVSNAQWRPKELPFTINGAIRTLTQTLDQTSVTAGNSSNTDTQLVTGTVGLNYLIAPRLTANAAVNANFNSIETRLGGASSTLPLSNQTTYTMGTLGGLNYFSLPTELYGFAYSWNAGTNAQALFGSEVDGNQSASATIGHSVTRALTMPLIGLWTFSASESGRIQSTSGRDTIPALSHSTGLSKSLVDSQSQTFIRLFGSDDRDLAGSSPTEHQLLSLQMNRTGVLTATSNWVAGLSVQTSRQVINNNDTGFLHTANGTAAYIHRNLLGVRNLSFRSDLTLSAVGFGTALDDRQPSERIHSQWENRVDYRIGKILMTLKGRVINDDGKLADLVLFQIRRTFD